MVLGLKPMGKPTTWMRKLSFGQNKILHGPRTQTYGETNYLDKKTEFWTKPRYCMVLGLKPMGKPTTWMRKLSFGETNHFQETWALSRT